MKYEIYKDFRITDDFSVFDFVSVGPHGAIPKRIEFMPTEQRNVYNLAFGDIGPDGDINDYSISDNGDRNRILATVAYIVDIYLDRYSHRWVYFTGSTRERTRLYRMAVGLNFEELSLKFDIYAKTETDMLPFRKNMPLIGILVKRKIVTL